MSAKRPDEFLEFSFELDPRLAERTNVFRFAVRLSGDEMPADAQYVARSLPSEVSRGTLVLCLPEEGSSAPTPVGPNGEICVLGNATMTSGPPEEVCAMIYSPPQGSYPAQPPSGHSLAQLVNVGSPSPTFDPPEFCGQVNFVFHPQFTNELQAAQHSDVGVVNELVLWQRKGSTTNGPYVFRFIGVSATGSQCTENVLQLLHRPASESSPGTSDLAGLPAKLFISLSTQNLGTREIPLVGGHETAIGSKEWKSCDKACPELRWKLWVRVNDGQPYVVAALNSLFGSRLETPLVWRAAAFDVAGSTELVCDNPADVPADMTRIFVRA